MRYYATDIALSRWTRDAGIQYSRLEILYARNPNSIAVGRAEIAGIWRVSSSRRNFSQDTRTVGHSLRVRQLWASKLCLQLIQDGRVGLREVHRLQIGGPAARHPRLLHACSDVRRQLGSAHGVVIIQLNAPSEPTHDT